MGRKVFSTFRGASLISLPSELVFPPTTRVKKPWLNYLMFNFFDKHQCREFTKSEFTSLSLLEVNKKFTF